MYGKGWLPKPNTSAMPESDGDHVSGADQTIADIGSDGLFLAIPERVQRDVAAQADHRQTHQKYCDLDKSDYRTAVQAKQRRLDPQGEDQQTQDDDHQTQSERAD